MASTHKHIRSSTANKRPTTAIADGQLALNNNSASPGLFFKDSTGATIIKIGPVHVGATAPNASPAAGGSAGNSSGEVWLDNSLTPVGVKIWDGSAWVNATPIGSTTVQGLLELATDAETQAGSDNARAVTPASLQSKVSDSTSTTSSTTIASSTAVKAAYDLANAALPKTGGTVTGNLEIGTTGSLSFEGSTADGFETTIAVVDPTADRTITLPNTTGTVVTTGDTGTVTSTMLADGTIVDADISASAEIAVSKLADGTARQLLQTDAAGTGVEWTSNIDIPGTLDVTGAAAFDSSVAVTGALTKSGSNVVTVGDTGTVTSTMIANDTIVNADINSAAAIAGTKISPDFGSQTITTSGLFSHALGTAGAPTITFTGDTNTGIYSPGADQVAISTNGTGRLFVAADGKIGVGTSPSSPLHVYSVGNTEILIGGTSTPILNLIGGAATDPVIGYGVGALRFGTTTGAGAAGFSEKVRITSAGLVGVGTSSPGALFDATQNANAVSQQIRLTNTNTVGTVGSAIKFQGFYDTALISSDGVPGVSTGGSLRLQTYSSNGVLNTGINVDRLGNVGVGTTSPGATLDVRGNGTFTGNATARQTVDFTNTGGQLYVGVESSAGGAVFTGSSAYAGIVGTNNSTNLQLATNGAVRATLDTSGRLGIGVSSPGALFDVSGGGGNGRFQVSPTPGVVYYNTLIGSGGYGSAINDATQHIWYVGGAEAARITNSGRLGIGTTSVGAKFHIDDASTGALIRISSGTNGSARGVEWYNNNTANVYGSITSDYTSGVFTYDAGRSVYAGIHAFRIGTGGEAARIDSSGRLLVGTSTSRDKWFNNAAWGNPAFQLETAVSVTSVASIVNNANDDGPGALFLAKSRAGSVGGVTVVNNNDFIGRIAFQGADGTEMVAAAMIEAQVDGTPGANDMPGRLVFSTTADGASSPTERMRIDNAGLIIAGSSGTNGMKALLLYSGQINTSGGLFTLRTVNDNNGGYFQAMKNAADSIIGTISQSGTTGVAYNTTSDYRLKENVERVADGITRLQQLKPSRFNFIADPGKTVDGFIAHEVQEVVPEAITGEKDAIDDDGNPVYQGIDQSKLVPLLTAALQEAIGRIETLEAEVAALKAQ